jgi:hypothetical protein
MTKNEQINNKSDTKHAGLKSETENNIRIEISIYIYTYIIRICMYMSGHSQIKSYLRCKSMNYDVCQQLQPAEHHKRRSNSATIAYRVNNPNSCPNLTWCDLTEKPTHTSRSLRKSQPTFHWRWFTGLEYTLSLFSTVTPTRSVFMFSLLWIYSLYMFRATCPSSRGAAQAALGMKLYNDQRNAQVFNLSHLRNSALHFSGFLLTHLQRRVYTFSSGSSHLRRVSAPGCWHHNQQTRTTAEIVHLPLKMS